MSKKTVLDSVSNASEFKDQWDKELDESILINSLNKPPGPPLETFRGFWSKVIENLATSCSSPPDYIMGMLLVTVATLLGNARRATWKSWNEPTTLRVLLVGAVSAGKTPAFKTVFQYLSKIQLRLNKAFKDEKSKWVADCNRLITEQYAGKMELKQGGYSYRQLRQVDFSISFPPEPKKTRLFIMDTTTQAVAPVHVNNPKGLGLFRDEISGFIKDFNRFSANGGDREFWTESYNGNQYTVDRKTDEDDHSIPHCAISIVGGIQPKKLSLLTQDDDEDGFYERFLFIWPEPAELVDPIDIIEDERLSKAFETLQRLEMPTDGNGDYVPKKVPLSPGAIDELRLFRQEMRKKASEQQTNEKTLQTSGLLGNVLGKMAGTAMRLSLVFEYLWAIGRHAESRDASQFCEPAEVSQEAMLAACALIDSYFIPMARRALNDALVPRAQRNAAIIARHIKEMRFDSMILNPREMRNSKDRPGGLPKDCKQIEEALEYLCDDGWVKSTPGREGEHRGRQRKDYVIHPKYWPKEKK